MGLNIHQLSPPELAAWDEFVLAHPHGSPFHTTAWMKSIEETYKFAPMYLMASEGSLVRAVLPLFLVDNFLTGKALISSPYAVYGGILADSAGVQQEMAQHLRVRADFLQVQYVELRNAYPEQSLGFTSVARYVTFTQRIGPQEDEILNNIPRKTRAMIRKALGHGLTTRIVSDYRNFLELYTQSLRRLGTPAFSARHFEALLRNFRETVDIRETLLDGTTIAAVLTFYFRDQVLPYYGASDPSFNNVAPNNFMYFDLMRQAGKQNYRVFDFGRSKRVPGSYDFKSHWGMVERSLPYEILPVKKKELPNYSPTNPKFDLPIKIWQRLPLPLTRALGPSLIRLVP